MDMELQVFCAMRRHHLEHGYPDFYNQLVQARMLHRYLDNFAIQCMEIVEHHQEWFQNEVKKGSWTNPWSMETANKYRAVLEDKMLPLITAPPSQK